MHEITIGLDHPGAQTDIVVEWDDEGKVHHRNRIELRLENFDKPRTLTIVIDTVPVARVSSWEGLVIG